MASGEETPKGESCDSAVSSTLKKHERCETSSKPKKHRSKSKRRGAEEDDYAEWKAPLFSQKNEIKLLKELVKFREKFGNVNRWIAFHKMSELQHHYSEMQITEKMRRLRDRFKRARHPPPPDADPREARIFELSKSLWGTAPQPPAAAAATANDTRRGSKRVSAGDDGPSSEPKRRAAAAAAAAADTRRGSKRVSAGDDGQSSEPKRRANPEDFPRLSEFFGDVKVPGILRSHWALMGSEAALEFEQQWRNLYVKEISLCHEKLVLKREICVKLSEIIHRDVLAVQSSSPREDEYA